MARYLVVAHQTATSPSLIERAQRIAADDPDAAFTLLVPATHPMHLLTREGALFTWDEVEAEQIARARADEARARFEDAGLHVERTTIGDASPILAIEDELRLPGGDYDAILLSTLPPGVSRWLAMDIHIEAERLDLPVIHVYEGITEAAARRLLMQRPLAGRIARWWQARARLLAGVRPSTRLLLAVMLTYLTLAATLALNVNRTFFLNDLMALLVFGGLLVALGAIERRPQPVRRQRGSRIGWGFRNDDRHET